MIKLMNAVDEVRGVKGSAKSLLYNLARRADDRTRLAWPSQQLLAAEAGCCEETVRVAIKKLIEQGHISVLRTQAKVNIYFLHPGDTRYQLPKLPWAQYESHLNKGFLKKSSYGRIAGWLSYLGVSVIRKA